MINRRTALTGLAGALALPAIRTASAQAAWPTARPIRMIVPFPPGGSTDVLSRVIGERLSAALGQTVVIENRPGSAGNVGVNAIARADADGYTIGVSTIGPLSAHVELYRSLPFNPRTDFTYLADIYEIPNIFVVNPQNPVKTVQEFIAWAKEKGAGKVSYGTPGIGTTAHLSTEFFSRKVGIELLHVPYRTGAVAVQDLIAGRIDMMFDNLPTIIGQIQGKTIKPIAVSTARRWPDLPDLPTMIESGIAGFDVTSWSGMLAPKGIPDAIAQRLTAELVKIGEDPAFVKRFQDMGAISTMKGPDVLKARVESEIPRWAEVVRAAGAKVD
ncbi:Bug family tripartite tricarboxylate transporter substrate binding protein [Phreatobacter sp.]|uniref:Bug family tripartite tricarboxylate transporter substrate binding protein n=1 Tax=Phreatobacter sp. TaxID=1966341 RepID=UPI003F721ED6